MADEYNWQDSPFGDKAKRKEIPDFDDMDDEIEGDENCPACGKEYDEIDFEYQICHHCKFNNNH